MITKTRYIQVSKTRVPHRRRKNMYRIYIQKNFDKMYKTWKPAFPWDSG